MTDRYVYKDEQVVELQVSEIKHRGRNVQINKQWPVTSRAESSSTVWIIVCHLSRLYKRASKFGGTVVFSNTINRLHTILSSSLNPIIGLGSQQISALHYTCYSWSTEYLGNHDGILFFLQLDVKLIVFVLEIPKTPAKSDNYRAKWPSDLQSTKRDC